MNCSNCIHEHICYQKTMIPDDYDCSDFQDEHSAIFLPCCIGDVVYYITSANVICKAVVDGIRLGRKRGPYNDFDSEKFITLRSDVGDFQLKIGFNNYKRNTFTTYEAAHQEVSRRNENIQ